MTLQSMTDYVLAEHKNYDGIETTQNNFDNIRILAHKRIVNYANFLKQPIKLGMFIPCDENDVPLELPTAWDFMSPATQKEANYKAEKYQQAKERVLFEGFEIKNSKIYNEEHIQFLGMIGNPSKYAGINPFRWIDRFVNTKTIEDLVKYNLKLTDSAIKQLNL